MTVETHSLRVQFQGAAVVSLLNRATSEEYVTQPGPDWITVSMMETVDTQSLAAASDWTIAHDPVLGTHAKIQFASGGRHAELLVGVDPDTDEMILRLTGRSGSPGVQSALWGVFGLDLDQSRLVIPGQAGTFYGKDTTPHFVGLDYPAHWESQFIIYEAPQGSLLIYAHEPVPNFKRLHASRGNGNLDFGFEVFAVAPWVDATETPALELRWRAFEGDWKQPTQHYKDWWRQTGPGSQTAAAAPTGQVGELTGDGNLAWTRDIHAVITILYLDILALDGLAEAVDPTRTLLHIVPWRLHGFDINYPDYTPAADANAYVERARELGFRVMLHTNALGISETNEHYERLQQYQLRTANTRELVGWLWDLEPGHFRRLAYINPASQEYRQLFIESIRPAIEQLRPDALHLDAGGAVQNDGNGLIDGLTSMQGLVLYHQDIQAAFPGLALGYESITEVNAPFIQFAQRWSSDSPPHPVATYFFGHATRFYGFLDQPPPDDEEFIAYLRRYEGQGILPTAPISSQEDLDEHRPRLASLLKQMRHWQEHQFEPDWDSDWGGAIFRFRSRDGEHAATVEESDDVVSLSIDGQAIYRRLRNVTSKQHPGSIPGWPGYFPGGVTGLNPHREYWLEDDPPPGEKYPHLRDVPSSTYIANSSFVHENFALFDLKVNEPPSYNFIGEFAAAKKGTFYRGFGDFGVINGATLGTTPVVVEGTVRDSAIVMHPPYQRIWGGVVFVEYTVSIPDAPGVRFNFDVALADASERTVPAVFAVWVNGDEIWRDYYAAGQWHTRSLSLDQWRGRTIRLRLISGGSQSGNPERAISCWSNLRIDTSPYRPDTRLQLVMPKGSIAAHSSQLTLSPTADETLFLANLDVPNRLAVFAERPPTLEAETSLLDLPFSNFVSAYKGMMRPTTSNWQGQVRDIRIGPADTVRGLFLHPSTAGRIHATWAVTLPESIKRIEFQYGLEFPSPDSGISSVHYSGATFHVFINGEEVFQEYSESPGVLNGSVDLAPWAGSSVLIQLAVDADGTAIFDWGYFAEVIAKSD